MAAEEILCPICGQPLLGRDRFEGKCAACREKEVLGGPPARGGLEATDGATVECPECCAANPPGLAFCDQCGARLRPRRRRILAAALLALAAGALAVAYVATRGPAPARSPRGEAQAPAEAPGEPPAAGWSARA